MDSERILFEVAGAIVMGIGIGYIITTIGSLGMMATMADMIVAVVIVILGLIFVLMGETLP